MERAIARSLADALRLILAEHDKQQPPPPDTPAIVRARLALKNFETHAHPWTLMLSEDERHILRMFIDRPLEGAGPIHNVHRRLCKLGLLTFEMIDTPRWRLELSPNGQILAETR